MKKIKLINSLIVCSGLGLTLTPILTSCSKATDGAYRSDKVTSNLYFSSNVQSFVNNVDIKYGYDLAYQLAYDTNYSQWLGWRSAGSQAEHDCADLLAKEMEKIGLADVSIENVGCDSFEFKESYLKINNQLICYPASYQMNGTGTWNVVDKKPVWTPSAFTSYPIYDLGNGKEINYANFTDLPETDYIALIGVDQDNEMWIDSYIRQAQSHGAKGLITYSIGGFGEIDNDTVNVQDVCAGTDFDKSFPTVAISYNQAQKIKQLMTNKKVENVELYVDSCVLRESDIKSQSINSQYTPYTCDVIGRIPGVDRSRQIVLSAHYDKYWFGFQDDSLAVGLVMSVAKALIDSGYRPECDIAICLTGAEEWGRADSNFDWTTGAWGILAKTDNFTNALNKNWAEKTIALLNCELPGYKPDAAHNHNVSIGGCQEVGTIISDFVKSGLCVTSGSVGIDTKPFVSGNTDDGISYRSWGVPNFINYFAADKFRNERYHTSRDDKDTFNADVFKTNANWFGALAIYLDKNPALKLDFNLTSEDLLSQWNHNQSSDMGLTPEEIFQYETSINNLSTKGNEVTKVIDELNSKYDVAVKANNKEEISKLKIEGWNLTNKVKSAFGCLNALDYTSSSAQPTLLMTNTDDCFYGHKTLTNNFINIKDALNAAKNQNINDVIENLSAINGGRNIAYTDFSEATGLEYFKRFNQTYFDETKRTCNEIMWGWWRQLPSVTGDSTWTEYSTNPLGSISHTISLLAAEHKAITSEQWNELITQLNAALTQNKTFLSSRLKEEITVLDNATKSLSE